jgi:hypothetical protein
MTDVPGAISASRRSMQRPSLQVDTSKNTNMKITIEQVDDNTNAEIKEIET